MKRIRVIFLLTDVSCSRISPEVLDTFLQWPWTTIKQTFHFLENLVSWTGEYQLQQLRHVLEDEREEDNSIYDFPQRRKQVYSTE